MFHRLFGISNLQLYVYYSQYPKDWIVYKVSVSTPLVDLPRCIHSNRPSTGCGVMVSHYAILLTLGGFRINLFVGCWMD